MAQTLAGEPSYRDVSNELAELILKTAEALADRARVTADAGPFADGRGGVSLHANGGRQGGRGVPGTIAGTGQAGRGPGGGPQGCGPRRALPTWMPPSRRAHRVEFMRRTTT